MELTGRITADSLMGLEAYEAWRREHKTALMAHRRLRSLALGEHMTLQFESERTMRYQIQEVLRAERVVQPAAIAQEVAAYGPLVPDGTNWKATLLIAHGDAPTHRQLLAQLRGAEDRIYLQRADGIRVYAIADEDFGPGAMHKPAAVHFLRFELPPAMRAAVGAGAPLTLGCDHARAPVAVAMGRLLLDSLAEDLR